MRLVINKQSSLMLFSSTLLLQGSNNQCHSLAFVPSHYSKYGFGNNRPSPKLIDTSRDTATTGFLDPGYYDRNNGPTTLLPPIRNWGKNHRPKQQQQQKQPKQYLQQQEQEQQKEETFDLSIMLEEEDFSDMEKQQLASVLGGSLLGIFLATTCVGPVGDATLQLLLQATMGTLGAVATYDLVYDEENQHGTLAPWVTRNVLGKTTMAMGQLLASMGQLLLEISTEALRRGLFFMLVTVPMQIILAILSLPGQMMNDAKQNMINYPAFLQQQMMDSMEQTLKEFVLAPQLMAQQTVNDIRTFPQRSWKYFAKSTRSKVQQMTDKLLLMLPKGMRDAFSNHATKERLLLQEQMMKSAIVAVNNDSKSQFTTATDSPSIDRSRRTTQYIAPELPVSQVISTTETIPTQTSNQQPKDQHILPEPTQQQSPKRSTTVQIIPSDKKPRSRKHNFIWGLKRKNYKKTKAPLDTKHKNVRTTYEVLEKLDAVLSAQ